MRRDVKMLGIQIKVIVRRISKYLLITLTGISLLALFSYLYDIFSFTPTVPLSSAQQKTIAEPQPTATSAQPTPTPQITDYRAILLLERATDLMVKYIDKIRAGEIDPSDTSIRLSYLQAFPVAIDAYNHATPTSGMEHGWKNVTMVAQAFTLVYPVIQQGDMVSDNDLFNMRSSQQWLINYLKTEEAVLSSRGVGTDFLTAEKQAVDQLLQENSGGTPVPSNRP